MRLAKIRTTKSGNLFIPPDRLLVIQDKGRSTITILNGSVGASDAIKNTQEILKEINAALHCNAHCSTCSYSEECYTTAVKNTIPKQGQGCSVVQIPKNDPSQ